MSALDRSAWVIPERAARGGAQVSTSTSSRLDGASLKGSQGAPTSSPTTAPHDPVARPIRAAIKPRAPQVLQSSSAWGSHTEPAQLSFNFTRS